MTAIAKAIATLGLTLSVATVAQSASVEGTFTAIVTEASDPGQASFGRDPAEWVGELVTGTFRYDIETPNIVDQATEAQIWTYADPFRNTRWAYVTASIDGVEFVTSARDPVPTGTIGGTIGVWDGTFFGLDWYSVQDAYLSHAGRSVIVFDVFGPPDLFAYAGGEGGIVFEFDPSEPGVSGVGLIEDLAISAGVTTRSGLIRFRLISLSFGQPTEALIENLLESVTGVGPGRSLADKVALVQAYYAAGDVVAACAMLGDFQRQVKAQNGKKLSALQATEFLGEAEEIGEGIGCE